MVRRRPPENQWEHGVANTYKNYGCRCDLCKKANTEYTREWYKRTQKTYQRKRIIKPEMHGTVTGYNYGCRCLPCRDNWASYQRSRRGGTAAKNPGSYQVVRSTSGNPLQDKHGTTTGYRAGCRCDFCREAVNVYQRVRNGGTAPAQAGKFNVKKSTSGGNKHE